MFFHAAARFADSLRKCFAHIWLTFKGLQESPKLLPGGELVTKQNHLVTKDIWRSTCNAQSGYLFFGNNKDGTSGTHDNGSQSTGF
jgi:hypothetical protein